MGLTPKDYVRPPGTYAASECDLLTVHFDRARRRDSNMNRDERVNSMGRQSTLIEAWLIIHGTLESEGPKRLAHYGRGNVPVNKGASHE